MSEPSSSLAPPKQKATKPTQYGEGPPLGLSGIGVCKELSTYWTSWLPLKSVRIHLARGSVGTFKVVSVAALRVGHPNHAHCCAIGRTAVAGELASASTRGRPRVNTASGNVMPGTRKPQRTITMTLVHVLFGRMAKDGFSILVSDIVVQP